MEITGTGLVEQSSPSVKSPRNIYQVFWSLFNFPEIFTTLSKLPLLGFPVFKGYYDTCINMNMALHDE